MTENKGFDLKAGGDTDSFTDTCTSIPIENKKEPRVRLYCSDGIYEEYSTDEDDIPPPPPPVDPKTLNWTPWFLHYIFQGGSKVLKATDYAGEKLAWFLGITSPKYQYIIDEVNRMKAVKMHQEVELQDMQNGNPNIDKKV